MNEIRLANTDQRAAAVGACTSHAPPPQVKIGAMLTAPGAIRRLGDRAINIGIQKEDI